MFLQVHLTENVVRETRVYLTHISRRCKQLAKTTIFLQDDHDKIASFLDPTTKVVPYSQGKGYDVFSGVVREGWRLKKCMNSTHLVSIWITHYLPDFEQVLNSISMWMTVWRGSFSVSSERVMSNFLVVYQEALQNTLPQDEFIFEIS